MTFQGWLLIIAFVAILLALTKPLGKWMYALYAGERTPLHRILGPVEHHGGIGIDAGMAQALLAEIGHDIGLVVYQRQRGGAG